MLMRLTALIYYWICLRANVNKQLFSDFIAFLHVTCHTKIWNTKNLSPRNVDILTRKDETFITG